MPQVLGKGHNALYEVQPCQRTSVTASVTTDESVTRNEESRNGVRKTEALQANCKRGSEPL